MLLIPREKAKKNAQHFVADEESQPKSQVNQEKKITDSGTSSSDETTVADQQLIRNTSVFTWKNLSYTVKTPSGDRTLLDNVHGWVKPGSSYSVLDFMYIWEPSEMPWELGFSGGEMSFRNSY